MPRWISRLLWAVRGKRRVRLHFHGDGPSIEGILVGKWGGHYVLLSPKLVEGETPDHQTIAKSLGGTVEIPELQVAFYQVFERAR